MEIWSLKSQLNSFTQLFPYFCSFVDFVITEWFMTKCLVNPNVSDAMRQLSFKFSAFRSNELLTL